MFEHITTSYSNSLDMIEKRGYVGGENIYRELINVEQKNISLMQEEYARLNQALKEAVDSGEIAEFSEQWYKMREDINKVDEAIQESNQSIVEYGNSLRQLKWDAFDSIQSRITDIADESEFLINLLDGSDLYEDNGQLTGAGMGTMGLTTMRYGVYMAQADQYADEIKKLNAEIANDPSNKDLITRRDELLKLQRQSISAAEDEKDAVKDLVEEGINKELDALKDLIDEYEDALDRNKSLFDYNKKVTKQTKEIAKLQKQLAAYSNDNSEETRAKAQKLRVDLADSIEDLQETQYDQYIKDQKQLLSDLYDDYEEKLNERLDDVNLLMRDMIDATNTSAAEIASTIADAAQSVGYTITDELSSIWSGDGSLAKIVSEYGGMLSNIDKTVSAIAENVASMSKAGDAIGDQDIASAAASNVEQPASASKVEAAPVQATTQTEEVKETTPDILGTVKVRKKNGTSRWYLYSDGPKQNKTGERVKAGEEYDYLGEEDGYTKILYNGQIRWFNSKGAKVTSMRKVDGFSKGGFVADLENKMRSNNDDILTINTLKQGEAVFTPDEYSQIKRLVDSLPNLQNIIDTSGIMRNIGTSGMTVTETKIDVGGVNIPIDHVENYDDFVRQLRDDKTFEKMIGSMTLDKIVGKSSLAKKKYYN